MALEDVRDTRDVAIDLKVFCNATGRDGNIDDLYDRAVKLEHLPYQGCTSKDPHDQFVFDGVTAINCTFQKLRVACALAHFDKSTTIPQFVWGDHQARVKMLVEQLQEHENILGA